MPKEKKEKPEKEKKEKKEKKDKKNDRKSMTESVISVNGQLMNVETNQKVFFTTHFCSIFRETLGPTDSFLSKTAEEVMEKNKKKRFSHGSVFVLEDRFTLEKSKPKGKEPFRTWLGYNEIEDIQRSKAKPEILVISVDSKSGQKYYEVYKCKNKEDSYKFENFIRQAMEDPEYRIRDGPVIDVVAVKDDSDLRRSILDFQASLESSDDENKSCYQSTSPTRPQSVMEIASPEVVAPVHAAAPRSPSPVKKEDEDTIYIQYDHRSREAWIDEQGPVFMYMVRIPRSPEPSHAQASHSNNSYGYN